MPINIKKTVMKKDFSFKDCYRDEAFSLEQFSSWKFCTHHLFFFFFFFFLRATPRAYGSSQARVLKRDPAAGLHHSHSNNQIWSAFASYATAHDNTTSLTHRARPGIKPVSSLLRENGSSSSFILKQFRISK